jgi:hypothetical protein
MKNSLPGPAIACGSLLVAILFARAVSASGSAAIGSRAAGGAEAVPQASAGDRLLLQAAAYLERRQSVTARLAYRASIDGAQLSGRGVYLQQGSGEDIRIRMELHLAGTDASLLQVSNSRFVWFDRRLPTGRTVTRIDLRQLRSDPVLAATGIPGSQSGDATWLSGRPDIIAQFGGLPRLLATLTENFRFLPPQAMRLVSAKADPEASVPFFAVVGHWKPEKLASLIEDSGLSAIPSSEIAAAVPSRVPLEVLLLFGQADLFPHRIEYRRLETQPAGAGPPTPFQLSARPIVILEFTDVVFDAPIAAGDFDYAPRDVDWVDQTAAVLERLRQERQATLATRPVNAPAPAPAR